MHFHHSAACIRSFWQCTTTTTTSSSSKDKINRAKFCASQSCLQNDDRVADVSVRFSFSSKSSALFVATKHCRQKSGQNHHHARIKVSKSDLFQCRKLAPLFWGSLGKKKCKTVALKEESPSHHGHKRILLHHHHSFHHHHNPRLICFSRGKKISQ